MPLALARIGSFLLKTIKVGKNVLNKTRQARSVFSLAKNTLMSKYREQEEKEPFYPCFLAVVGIFLLFVFLLIFNPSLIPAIAFIAL